MTTQAPQIRNPETVAEVESLQSAVAIICPGSHVTFQRGGPESAWVSRVRVPFRGGVYAVITKEIDGWQARLFGGHAPPDGQPLEHCNRDLLIEVVRDVVVQALFTRDVARA